MVVVAERQELVAGELCPIVSDDGVWNPEPVDDISEEQHRLLRNCNWLGLVSRSVTLPPGLYKAGRGPL